ncbi:hypothetical protein LWI28_007974 [Acer negundo]|uniref:Uncharacterized protein n=1 Tax=Acer negundo TaxID=4023 RepID=A0AAD5J997_ACENE|nr:hypothetical protein LWI28_007974 [Acer negundo]
MVQEGGRARRDSKQASRVRDSSLFKTRLQSSVALSVATTTSNRLPESGLSPPLPESPGGAGEQTPSVRSPDLAPSTAKREVPVAASCFVFAIVSDELNVVD